MELKGLKVLISGGTSGLGLALARQLLAADAQVATFARHSAPVPAGAHFFTADVGRKEDIHVIAGMAHALLGEIHVLINNASTLGPTPLRHLLDTDCEDFEAVLQTNLLGPFRLSKAIIPGMIARGGGWIINISSDAAVNGYPGWGAYGAAKAALEQLTRISNAELRQAGIRSLAVDPGDMHTALHLAAVPDADPRRLKTPEQAAGELLSRLRNTDFTADRIRL